MCVARHSGHHDMHCCPFCRRRSHEDLGSGQGLVEGNNNEYCFPTSNRTTIFDADLREFGRQLLNSYNGNINESMDSEEEEEEEDECEEESQSSQSTMSTDSSEESSEEEEEESEDDTSMEWDSTTASSEQDNSTDSENCAEESFDMNVNVIFRSTDGQVIVQPLREWINANDPTSEKEKLQEYLQQISAYNNFKIR